MPILAIPTPSRSRHAVRGVPQRLAPARACGALAVLFAAACGAATNGGPDGEVPPGRDGAPPDRRDAQVGPLPEVSCPDEPPLVDTSSPSQVVGDGSPASCTAEALGTAVSAGGVITFACGGEHTIELREALSVTADTVLDGGGEITLSGRGRSRILELRGPPDADTPRLTVQRLTFIDGRGPSSGDDVERGGGAIFRFGGSLTVLDSTFRGHRIAERGPDVAGGAIYSRGGGTTLIARSTFTSNRGANGGAIGSLVAGLTLLNVSLVGNAATGQGAAAGNGGVGGAIYIDGAEEATVLCGVAIRDNDANAIGGGLFRVSNTGTGTFRMDASTIRDNRAPDNGSSIAGGLYLQGLDVAIAASTIAGNEARFAGGLYYGPGCRGSVTNTTIAGNTALSSLGGGAVFDGSPSGLFLNVTFANNRAPGPEAFAGATVGSGVTFRNVVIDGHEAGNDFTPISCLDRLDNGGGNVQWPVQRAGGGSDDPDALCTNGILVQDPQLGPLADNGGPTPTLLPAAASPAVGRGVDCPSTDQRGEPRRRGACTSGAVEVP